MSAETAVLVLGRDAAELVGFVNRSPEAAMDAAITLLSNPGKRLGGYAAVANAFLDRSQNFPVAAIVHADTAFGPGAIAALAAAARSESQLTGIVGRSMDPVRPYVWGRDGGGEVSTLDSCAVFIPTALSLRFDGSTFDDFHCCVEDLCLQAADRGIRSFVPTADADHIGATDAASRPSWMASYHRYRARLGRKWSHLTFATT